MAEGSAVLENQDVQSSKPRPSFSNPEAVFADGIVEKVDHGKMIREIGEFYGVSPKKINESSESVISMWVFTDARFNQMKDQEIENEILSVKNSRLLKDEDKERALKELQLKRADMANIGGTTYWHEGKKRSFLGKTYGKKDTTEIIMRETFGLDREHVKIHELMHVLGAHDDSTGLRTFNLEFANINEAATEILTLAYLHRNLPIKELIGKIHGGEIKTGYSDDVKLLFSLMFDAAVEDKHFSVKDLADYYFGRKPGGVYAMAWDLNSRVEEGYKAKTQETLVNDLRKPRS